MGIFGKKKTLNSSGGGIEENLHDLRHTLKVSLDLQQSKFSDMDSIVSLNNDVNKNLDELKQALQKQVEQFPK